MNRLRLVIYAATGLLLGVAACSSSSNPIQKTDASDPASNIARVNNDAAEGKMRITIGSKNFTANLEENPTVSKLKLLLPLTLEMAELNGNEKYYHLSSGLPTDEMSPGEIQNGDIMLYGDNSLVLFYQSFKTSYLYTRLGRIDDPSELGAAVGSGAVTVTFESEE